MRGQLGSVDDRFEDEALGEATTTETPTEFPLSIAKRDFSIFELHRQWANSVLRLQPDFQRAYVWGDDKQIKLVESVFALIPLPVLYLSDDGEHLEVVDGQQRLTTLFAFMEGRFADASDDESDVILRRGEQPAKGRPFVLRKLRLMKVLDGMTFEKLDARLRRKFEETQLTCFVLQPKTAALAKFELFERINEGAVPLNPQEIRNALYQGWGLELVRQLGGREERFRQLAGMDRRYARMRADELVLRGIAFLWREPTEYKGDLKTFLNDTVIKLNKASHEERRDVERKMRDAIEFAAHVFGDKAWQRYDPHAAEWSNHISGPLVEAVSAAAVRVFPSRRPTAEQAAQIRRGFQDACGQSDFNNAILSATQTVRNVKVRLETFERICRRAL